jgi:redox-sensitive bicupin YhaK (pirin superfamily)
MSVVVILKQDCFIMSTKTTKGIYHGAPFNMVGNGFRVSNYFPHGNPFIREMSPFFLLDYNAPFDFSASNEPRGVGVHPHRGFETVTIVYAGELAHRDSSGSAGILHPGDVQWMTAGSGVVHEEFHSPEFSNTGGTLHMIQLWVNLPKAYKMTAPKYNDIRDKDMPRISADNGNGYTRIIAGEYKGVNGPAHTFSPIHLYDIRLDKGASTSFSFPADFNTAILVLSGNIKVSGERVAETTDFVLFNHTGEVISIEAEESSTLLLLSGEPLNEPVVSYGPFVMNTQEEIHQAFADFHSGKFGKL